MPPKKDVEGGVEASTSKAGAGARRNTRSKVNEDGRSTNRQDVQQQDKPQSSKGEHEGKGCAPEEEEEEETEARSEHGKEDDPRDDDSDAGSVHSLDSAEIVTLSKAELLKCLGRYRQNSRTAEQAVGLKATRQMQKTSTKSSGQN
ncbi:hypothetical protein KEM55_006417 [Ascosphaera atra]|nr:hypothetical protein KEM55_006417 [Ascosphaera atra]